MGKRKSYTILPKTYTCKIGKDKSAEYEALRADSAALAHVEATCKAQPAGKQKEIPVDVTDAKGRTLTIKIRDESSRKVTIIKG